MQLRTLILPHYPVVNKKPCREKINLATAENPCIKDCEVNTAERQHRQLTSTPVLFIPLQLFRSGVKKSFSLKTKHDWQ